MVCPFADRLRRYTLLSEAGIGWPVHNLGKKYVNRKQRDVPRGSQLAHRVGNHGGYSTASGVLALEEIPLPTFWFLFHYYSLLWSNSHNQSMCKLELKLWQFGWLHHQLSRRKTTSWTQPDGLGKTGNPLFFEVAVPYWFSETTSPELNAKDGEIFGGLRAALTRM